MKVKLVNYERALEIAERDHWTVTRSGSIVYIPEFVWDKLSNNFYPMVSSDIEGVIVIDDGERPLNWVVPVCFISKLNFDDEVKQIPEPASTRDEEILRAYKDLRARMKRAQTMWCNVEDDADHPSPEYVMYKGARQEIRGFCAALGLMGFDMEALAAVIEKGE